MTRRRLGVPGEERFLRKDVFYGAIQEMSFVEGGDAAVIGGKQLCLPSSGEPAYCGPQNLPHLHLRAERGCRGSGTGGLHPQLADLCWL